jgi:glycosyltransferase involved in cell wall biosynthesis
MEKTMKTMKKNVQIVQHLRPGGIETMALDLHDYFLRQGHESYIISLEGDMESALAAWPRLNRYSRKIVFLDKPEGFSVTFLMKLIRVLKELHATVLHTHHIGPLVYGGLAAQVVRPAVHIHTEHDAWHLENSHHRKLQKWLLRLARPVLVADAEAVAEAMRKFLKPRNLTVIRNGIDTARFVVGDRVDARRSLGLPLDKKIIGCSGRLELLKGQTLLIQSLTHLPDTVHVALAGMGSYEETLRMECQQLGLSDRVHFLGRIDDMPLFYQALDCFCLPSYKEGMPLSPLEAQSCGIPAIVTDVGGSKESLCTHTGSLIPAGDMMAIVDRVKQILVRPLNHSPRAFVQEHGDIDHMALAYSRLHPSSGL